MPTILLINGNTIIFRRIRPNLVVYKNIFQMFKDFTVKEKEKNKMIREIDRK